MLILSRKEEESIIIGENIKIKVVSIDKGSVKLGFEAPSNMLILREELKQAVESSNKEAAGKTSQDLSLLSQKFKK